MVLLQAIQQTTTAILKTNLVGIYLHGSYVLGSYNEQVSDLDYLIVVRRSLTLAEKRQLMTATITQLWPLAPHKGLEFHVLLLSATQHFVHPCPFDFHFSKYHYEDYQRTPLAYLKAMHGTDPDLAAHLTILQAAGQVLLGPAITTVFGPVPATAYWDSIKSDIANAETAIVQLPMYTVLNLCRVRAYQQDQLIISKQAGGECGLQQLPTQWHPLIRQALAAYAGQQDEQVIRWSRPNLVAFARIMLAELGLKSE